MQENLTRIRISIVIVLSISIGLILGIALDRQVINTQAIGTSAASGSSGNFQLLNDAWNIIQKNYVDQSAISETKLTYAAISGMVAGLGDTGHSRFLSPEMLKSEQTFTRGEFEGIGAIVEMKNNHVTIVSPIDNSPAQKAGLRAGDIITKVNGQNVDGLSLDEVVSHIIGPAGSQVVVSVLHPGATAPQDYTLTRAKITVNNVTWQWIPGTKIAHLRLAAFSSGVTDDLKKALIEIKASGATGVILDMRNNPGGLLSEAVGVASQFLDSGVVLEEKNANGKIDSVFVQPGGVATQIPMDVLVNQGTASAAEIVTGALQDAQRAVVIGETTIGTGTVLNTFDLPDGSALLLATQEWLTPKGRVIWHQGLTPDIEVKMDSSVYPLSPEAERQMTYYQWKTTDDIQLVKAFETLNPK
jgi:carboxyl-terminal processing protease